MTALSGGRASSAHRRFAQRLSVRVRPGQVSASGWCTGPAVAAAPGRVLQELRADITFGVTEYRATR